MATRHAALFDELTKIAEEQAQNKGQLRKALRTMGVAVAGGAAGYGLADLLEAKTNLFKPTQENFARRATAAKVIIPILSSAAVLLADRYRNKLNQEYQKVPGYEGPK